PALGDRTGHAEEGADAGLAVAGHGRGTPDQPGLPAQDRRGAREPRRTLPLGAWPVRRAHRSLRPRPRCILGLQPMIMNLPHPRRPLAPALSVVVPACNEA